MKCEFCDAMAWVTDAFVDAQSSGPEVSYVRRPLCWTHASERRCATSRFEPVMCEHGRAVGITGRCECPPVMSAVETRRMEKAIALACGGLKVENELVAFEIPEIGYGHLGVHGNTAVWGRLGGDKVYEVRMGFDVMGPQELPRWADTLRPFADKFVGNYCEGRGATLEAALRVMLRKMWLEAEMLHRF